MKIFVAVALALLGWQFAAAQTPADQWKDLAFLEGTWQAKTEGNGGGKASGTYTFRLELGGHVMARHSTTGEGCAGPNSFDCDHGDLLYVYSDGPGQPLKAIYFDNEGHVIHYSVSTPNPTSVIFLSIGSGSLTTTLTRSNTVAAK